MARAEREEREDDRKFVLLELDSLNTMMRKDKSRAEVSEYKTSLCRQLVEEFGVDVVNIKGQSYIAIAGTEAQLKLCEKCASGNANVMQGFDPDYNRDDIRRHEDREDLDHVLAEPLGYLRGIRRGVVPTFYERDMAGEIKPMPRRSSDVAPGAVVHPPSTPGGGGGVGVGR